LETLPLPLTTGCHSLGYTHYYEIDGQQKYKISTYDIDAIDGISSDEFKDAVFASADTWAEQANSGFFKYDGTVAVSDLPIDNDDCGGIDYNLVRIIDDSGDKGLFLARCLDSNNYPHRWTIVIKVRDLNDDDWNWSVGDISSDEWDLRQTLTHEFGHAIGLNHHYVIGGCGSDCVYGSMTPTSIGTSRSRDLYAMDMICLEELSGRRSLFGKKRTHYSNGTFSSESSFTSFWTTVSKVAPGLSEHSGSEYYTAVINRSDCMRWQHNWSIFDWTCLDDPDQRSGIGPRAGWWKEDTSIDRIFYSEVDDSPTFGDKDSNHIVHQVRSDDGFDTQSDGILSRCAVYIYGTCFGLVVKSGNMVSMAWDDRRERTVFAWADQERGSETNNRKLMLSVGYRSTTVLHKPSWTGYYSGVSPAVVCDEDTQRTYNCIVAFVSSKSTRNEIKVLRFYTTTTGTNPPYGVQIETTLRSISGVYSCCVACPATVLVASKLALRSA
jgi:hypothetical protein